MAEFSDEEEKKAMMLAHLSNIEGVGGEFNSSPKSFLVEEITVDGRLLELDGKVEGNGGQGDFTHFVLQKRGWGTLDALRALGKVLGCGPKRFSYAGMKDRQATTTQLAGVFKIEPERVLAVSVKDIWINGAWRAQNKVKMGSLSGNRFTINVDGVVPDCGKIVESIVDELQSKVPNYFGGQRFGIRNNSQRVGRAMVLGDYEGAVMEYLTSTGISEREEAREARERFAEERDFGKALQYFPKHLRYERTLLGQLEKSPRDFANALRRLPRGLSLLFVHAFQAQLFNQVLSDRIKAEEVGANTQVGETGNLIGYDSNPTERERAVLEEHSVKARQFKLKGMPELSSKGAKRPVLAELRGFSFEQKGQDGMFRFALGAGSYATMALREFIDQRK